MNMDGVSLVGEDSLRISRYSGITSRKGLDVEKREFLMLAHSWNPQKHKTEGSFLSEKLDGIRAVWIPQTRDMEFQKIVFANTNRDEREHNCSGLWSRYGKPIFAPAWFLDLLPRTHCLDGELFLGHKQWQTTASYTKKHRPVDEEWRKLGYYVFDIPSYVRLFEVGRINNPNFVEKLIPANVHLDFGIDITDRWFAPRRFEYNWQYLGKHYRVAEAGELQGTWGALRQMQLPMNRFEAESIVERELERVVKSRGEGLILRRPHSEWQPRRSDEVLKVKKMEDAEGTVVGYNYGFGKLYGMIGSIRLRAALEGKEVEFDLSGFTDEERTVIHEYRDEARLAPGRFVTKTVSDRFRLGDHITFQYRELTNDGKPKEARYLRPRPAGV
jgi:DNA ligase-1